MKQLAFVFPGQGSQRLGMLGAWQENEIVQDTFSVAQHVLSKDVWQLAQHGPEADLNLTVNAQPLLLTAGVALWRVWQSQTAVLPAFLAGHSLGEYTALVCSGAITLEQGVRLVAHRGKFMQEAVPIGKGAMAVILGLDPKVVSSICEQAAEDEVVSCANFNSPGQIVIAGERSAVGRALELAKDQGAKKAMILSLSVPSHCALMCPAAEKLEKVLDEIPILKPRIPVLHNSDASLCEHPDDIKNRLIEQLYCSVQWEKTIVALSEEGVEIMIECGPGKVLSGLNKRINSALTSFSIEDPEVFRDALQAVA